MVISYSESEINREWVTSTRWKGSLVQTVLETVKKGLATANPFFCLTIV